MTAFQNFVAAADSKGVNVMLDAPFNHSAFDCELDQKGLDLLTAAGFNTATLSATDKIKDREARFFLRTEAQALLILFLPPPLPMSLLRLIAMISENSPTP